MKFEIAKDQILHNWVVYRVGGTHEQHAHFERISACRRLIKLIQAGVYPYAPWYQEACRSLLTDEELSRLHKTKDRYYNHQRRA